MRKFLEFDVPSLHRPQWLGSPPAFRPDPPVSGWIHMHLEHPDLDGFPPGAMSHVYPPLDDLWLWSCAVALGLAPVRMRIDEEGAYLWLAAEPLPQDALRLSLLRVADDDPGCVFQHVAWREQRTDFLTRWSALWAAYFDDDSLPWREWEYKSEIVWPELARDFPWRNLVRMQAPTSHPWPRDRMIAWFFLLMAHDLETSIERGCVHARNPLSWCRRTGGFARLSVDIAEVVWCAFEPGPMPLRQDFDQVWAKAFDLAEAIDLVPDELPPKLRDDEQACFHVLEHHMGCVLDACSRAIECAARHLWFRFPLGQGGCLMDERGRRGRIILCRRNEHLVFWEDGTLSSEHMLYRQHGSRWRWPVRDGPDFDPAALDPIDARRYRFLLAEAAPLGIVCPCCGYPDLEDEDVEVQGCEICGWPLWPLLYGPPPALDDTVDDEGDPISPTLREARDHFLAHGDCHPRDARLDNEDDDYRMHWQRGPLQAELRRQLIADWEAWLADPGRDERPLPEPVWRRYNEATGRG